MLKLNFTNQTSQDIKDSIFENALKKINKYLSKLKIAKNIDLNKQNIIELTLVTDKEIQKMNKEYRGIDNPTDVLSFSYAEEMPFPGKEDVIGEILISSQSANKNLQQQIHKENKTLDNELEFLFIHGILHILGYTHDTDEELEIIVDLQKKIIGK